MKYRFYIVEEDEDHQWIDVVGTDSSAEAWEHSKWRNYTVIDAWSGERLDGIRARPIPRYRFESHFPEEAA